MDASRSDIGFDSINKKGLVELQPVLGQAQFRRRLCRAPAPDQMMMAINEMPEHKRLFSFIFNSIT